MGKLLSGLIALSVSILALIISVAALASPFTGAVRAVQPATHWALSAGSYACPSGSAGKLQTAGPFQWYEYFGAHTFATTETMQLSFAIVPFSSGETLVALDEDGGRTGYQLDFTGALVNGIVPYIPNAWNTVQADYNFAVHQYTVTVNGIQSSPIPFDFDTSSSVQSWQVHSSNAVSTTTAWLDSLSLVKSSEIDNTTIFTVTFDDGRTYSATNGTITALSAPADVPLPVMCSPEVVPVENLAVDGPHAGIAQVHYPFNALVIPITSTSPITYIWQAADQLPITHVGGLSDTVAFAWDMTGTQTITVTAINASGVATGTHSTDIDPRPDFPPGSVCPIGLAAKLETDGGFQWYQYLGAHTFEVSDTLKFNFVIVPFESDQTFVGLDEIGGRTGFGITFANGYVNDSGVAYRPNAWNSVQAEYNFATKYYTISVNGTTIDPAPFDFEDASSVQALRVHSFNISRRTFAWIDSMEIVRQSADHSVEALFAATFDDGMLPVVNRGSIAALTPDGLPLPTTCSHGDGDDAMVLTTESGYGSIRLNWSPSIDPYVAEYHVLRASDAHELNWLPLTIVSDTVYVDDDGGLVANNIYCYRIEAWRVDGTVAATSNTACTAYGWVELWIPDTWAVPDQTAIVPVNIRNAQGLRIAASDIWLDFDGSVIEPITISATALTTDYHWTYTVSSTGILSRARIAAVSPTYPPPQLFGDGSLFWISFHVRNTSTLTSPLDLREFIQGVGGSAIYTSDNLITPIPLLLQDGVFRVAALYMLGDLNGDGAANSADAADALSIANGEIEPTRYQLQAGDINGNSEIDAADASMILFYAAHGYWPPTGQSRVAPGIGGSDGVVLRLDHVSGAPGASIEVALGVEGTSQMAGGRFAITYDPKVIDQITVEPGGLVSDFVMRWHANGAGSLRAAFAANTPVSGNGLLATLRLRLAAGAQIGDSSPLTLADVQLNDIAGRDFATSAWQTSIQRVNGSVNISDYRSYLPMLGR